MLAAAQQRGTQTQSSGSSNGGSSSSSLGHDDGHAASAPPSPGGDRVGELGAGGSAASGTALLPLPGQQGERREEEQATICALNTTLPPALLGAEAFSWGQVAEAELGVLHADGTTSWQAGGKGSSGGGSSSSSDTAASVA